MEILVEAQLGTQVRAFAPKGGAHGIPRMEFIELHEQSWFPESLRKAVTSALQFGLNQLKIYSCVIPVLRRVLALTRTNQIIDMCSGAGGPWIQLRAALDKSGIPVKVCLTDKYPNLEAFAWVASFSQHKITFYSHSVDATKMSSEIKGFRTIFTSFHHFSAELARGILQNAVDAGAGIGIFEASARTRYSIVLMFLWTISQLLFAPFIRPFCWSRLFWTYVIPLVPLVLLFDGVVSCLRTYSPAELMEMASSTAGRPYRWEAGTVHAGPLRVPITFLVGYPVSRDLTVDRMVMKRTINCGRTLCGTFG
jgi:hypothetical protein